MKTRLISKPRGPLTSLAAGLMSALAGAAIAQTPAPAAATAAASTPASVEFRSALEGYQPYSEEKIRPWKEANDTVGQRGGWRAYAKEAQQGDAPAGPDATSQPDPHAGHGKPPQDKKP